MCNMLRLIYFSVIFHVNIAFSETPLQIQTRVFRNLYNDRMPGGRCGHIGACTGNAITFVREDLEANKVPFNEGYIIDFKTSGYIHYFQSARSDGKNFHGRNTVWSNGTPFYLSNYYNHTFVVLDGRVFDFSIRDGKIQKLSYYLRKSFLTPVGHSVECCGLTPEFNEALLIEKLSSPNTTMEIYRLDAVSKTTYPASQNVEAKFDLGKPSFIGRPIDIFLANGVVKSQEIPRRQQNAAKNRTEKLISLMKSEEFKKREHGITATGCLQTFLEN